jgi:hypothetical protein
MGNQGVEVKGQPGVGNSLKAWEKGELQGFNLA